MKLHHIRTYIAVIDQSSISSAARRLSLTPSTASAHIKALENEFGNELFTRSQRGVELTESGRKLEKQARLILQAAAEFAAQAQSCRRQVSGRLRLALSVSSNVFDLPAFVRRLDRDFPGIDLQLSHDESMRVLRALVRDDGEAGVVYGAVEDSRFRVDQLSSAELVIAFPRKWARPSWEACATLPWINTGADCPFQAISQRFFARHDMRPPQFLRADDNHTRRQLVAAGFGISLLKRAEAEHPEIALVDAEPLPCPVSLVSAAHRQLEPVIQAARALILNSS